MEAHGDSLMPQPGSHRRNACRPRARPRRRHVAPVDWMCRRCRSCHRRRSCRRSRAAVTTCVQIGYKGRFAFFRPATEPRNHAVSFRPFQSGKALCIQFGHRVCCRGRFGHRVPPHPDAQPRPNRSQTPNVSLMGGGSARRPHRAVRPGTFRAAGCGLLRGGAFDAAGNRNPVPARVRCPRLEGKVPGCVECPLPRAVHPPPDPTDPGRKRKSPAASVAPGRSPGAEPPSDDAAAQTWHYSGEAVLLADAAGSPARPTWQW